MIPIMDGIKEYLGLIHVCVCIVAGARVCVSVSVYTVTFGDHGIYYSI